MILRIWVLSTAKISIRARVLWREVECNFFLEGGRALKKGYGFHTRPKNPIMALISEYMLTADRLREGFNKKKTTNLGFWLNLRWVGVRRGSWCPTPLNGFSFIALN